MLFYMVNSKKPCICINIWALRIQIIWYQRFADYVYSIGFSQSKSDNSLFIYRKDTHMAYLLLYVDDIILTTSSDDLRKSIISRLSSEFAIKDLGPLSYFLGIAVTRHDGG